MKFLCCVLALFSVALTRREILRRHGDYFLRLGNDNGKLVLDEGDIVPVNSPLEAPATQYTRSKRIAHVKDYEKYVAEQQNNQYDYIQNKVNVDTLAEDQPTSGTGFVGIKHMLQAGSLNAPVRITPQDLAIAELYGKDTSHCLQK